MTETEQAVAEFEAQGVLEPGQEGWWKVWGAKPHAVRTGDLVLTDPDGEWELVTGTFQAKAYPMRAGLELNGEICTIGALCPIVVVRKGTHNTLA